MPSAPPVGDVLFVGHDASRTGAPIVLRNFMRWYKDAFSANFSCALITGGSLEGEFTSLCTTVVIQKSFWRNGARPGRILKKAHLSFISTWLRGRLISKAQSQCPAVVYCNTILSLTILGDLPFTDYRLVCHVHELEFAFRSLLTDKLITLLTRVDRFIACSHAVAENLQLNHQIPSSKIDVVHEFIPSEVINCSDAQANGDWLRDTLSLQKNTLLVGGSGNYGWRKGTDLFVQVARLVKGLGAGISVHFVWLGGEMTGYGAMEFQRDIEVANLSQFISIIPSQDNPLKFFASFDLFILTSREDPYPLVCLEAAACGVPIIAFDKAGGIPEFIEADAGAVVPYLDVAAMAAEIIRLLQDTNARSVYGKVAKAKVRARHDIQIAAPRVMDSLIRACA